MGVASPEQLLARLAKGQPVPGILLLGGETFLRDLCRRKITDAYVPESARDWGLLRISADDESAAGVLGQAQTVPMLAERRVIFVSDVNAWERLGEKSSEEMLELLGAYFKNPAPFTVLVFEADALDKRKRLSKFLSDELLVVSVELAGDPAGRAKMAAPLAVEMAHELGVEIDRAAAEELAEVLNGDLQAMHSEIAKLATWAGDRKKITRQDVEMLVVSSKKYSVWELADMLAARQPSQTLTFLDSLLREGEQLPALLGAVAWMYRKLLEAQELPASTSGWQAASKLGMRPNSAEMAIRQSRKFPRSQLVQGIAALYEADTRLKSGGTSQRAVMEFLLIQLTSSQPG